MILDALRAELFKLIRNRWAAFFAFGLAPLFTFSFGVFMEFASRTMPQAAFIAYESPLMSALDGLAAPANIVMQLFLILGAAIIFAGEYRWETWRSILPRSERLPLLVAKFAAFAIAAAVSLVACGVAEFVVSLIGVALIGHAAWPTVGVVVLTAAMTLGFIASFLQVMATAAAVAVVAVVTRSMMAAIIVPFLVLIGLEIAGGRVYLRQAGVLEAALPNLGARGIRETAGDMIGDPDAIGLQLAEPGAIFLVMWIVLLFAAALLVFQRQDLSRE